MDRYTHVHVCGGSEPEYTSGRKDFILGSRLEGRGGGQKVFSSLKGPSRGGGGGGKNILKAALRGTDVFSTYVANFKSPRLVVINNTSLTTLL